jgi:hypothetical protein
MVLALPSPAEPPQEARILIEAMDTCLLKRYVGLLA